MTALEGLQALLLISGALFFMVGSLGLLRLPDVYTRLHALTKVDNLGLGLVVAGLLLGAGSAAEAVRLLLVWLAALAAGATVGHLVAHNAHQRGVRPLGSVSRGTGEERQ